MGRRDYADLYDIAHSQGRHSDSVILALLSIQLLLGSAGAVALSELPTVQPNGIAVGVTLAPLLLAIFALTVASVTCSHYVPVPQDTSSAADEHSTDSDQDDLWKYCFLVACRENSARKIASSLAVGCMMSALVSFVAYVRPNSGRRSDIGEVFKENPIGISSFLLLLALFFVFFHVRARRQPGPSPRQLVSEGRIVNLEAKPDEALLRNAASRTGAEVPG